METGIGTKEGSAMKKIYAFLMMAATMVACMQMEQPAPVEEQETPKEQEQTVQTYTMTVEATKSGDKDTKALSLDGKTLSATWAQGERVTVRNVTKSTDLGGYLEAQSSGSSTTLKGDLTGTIEPNDKLILKFLSPDYSSQDGTLEYIAAHCDYAESNEITVTVVSGNRITASDATFTNQQAIIKFTLKDKGNNDAAISASAFTITDGTSTVSLTDIPAATYTANEASNVLYVAFPAAGTAKTINLTATVGTSIYTYEKTGVTFANSQYYEITVKMTPAGAIPGVFSVDGTKKVYFSKGNLQATYNGGAWSWAFAEHQWDYIGAEAGNTSISGNGALSSNGTVDLFGWSTAATTLGIHNAQNYADYSGVFADWGSNANVQAGIGTGWHMLSRGEWNYLFNSRNVNGGTGYTLGQSVNDVLGVVIYPDNYTGSTYTTGSNWATFEAAGCVFLPAAGYREGTSVTEAGTSGRYWAETSDDDSSAHYVYFTVNGLYINNMTMSRDSGLSVRLVRNAN